MEIPGYKIEREIGKGGMATAYLAIQESLERPVVLKILNRVTADKSGESDESAERFIDEGRIIAALTHPNIITIYDIGISHNLFYISMEYVQGGDLKQRLELPISPDEALEYLEKVASALDQAHRHGIVHRDVKPANILFRDAHTPLLTDFGIAKHVDTETNLTSTGIFLGSPNYVSPEQADGVKIDGRTDIYSLGCIFHEMLTGKKPYISDSVIDVVIKHKRAPLPKLPAELREFQPLLNRMLAKRRNKRIPDAEKLLLEINKLQKKRKATVMTNLDVTTRETKTPPPVRAKRTKQILIGLGLSGLVLLTSLKYIGAPIKQADGPAQATTQNITPTSTGGATDTLADNAPPRKLNRRRKK